MKRLLFCVAFLSLFVMAVVPTWAQDAKDCGADGIKNRMNELVADYLSAQAKATDASDALAAAQALQDAVSDLTAGCANADATTTTEAAPNGMPTEGKWMLTWKQKTKSCPADNYIATLSNRPVQLQVSTDGKTLLLNDLYWLRKAEFKLDKDGNYTYIRNEGGNSGSPFTFTYVLSHAKAEVISGTSTDYIPRLSCKSLQGDFTLTLVDANMICMVGSESIANLRSGPGTTFDRFGTLDSTTAVDVVGYAMSKDGFKWWKLARGGWIRSDLVKEAGRCADVPEIKA